MAAKILEFAKRANGYRLQVHLDEERTLPDEDGAMQPDPYWVHEWTFPNLHPEIHTQGDQPLTEKQFIENVLEELPRMVEIERHRRNGTSPHDAGNQPFAYLRGKEIHHGPH